MYIWRGKNRRDKRNLLLLGEQAWTAGIEDKDHVDEDERLRYEKEKQHVEYFSKRIRHLMEEYMETPEGKDEISLLRKELELERRSKKKLLDSAEDRLNEADAMRKNVLEIFRHFSIPDSESHHVAADGETNYVGGLLNAEGLQNMLSFLSLHLSKKQLEKYKKRLHLDEIKTTITFVEFYKVFLEDLEERGKTLTAYIANLFTGKSKRQRDQMTEMEQLEEEESKMLNSSTNVSWFLQLKLQSVEARVILVDEAVATSEQLAVKEFRVVHPPVFLCDQCDGSFPGREILSNHQKDKKFHREFFRKQVAEDERFRLVRKIFDGDKGRRLWANRLIFSSELGTQQSRVAVAREEPYRPSLNDPNCKKHDQLLRGMFVTGFDPKSGIRPNYRRNGMKKLLNTAQTPQEKEAEWLLFQRNPTKLPSKTSLQEIVLVLNRCHDEFVDIVSTLDHPDVKHLSDSDPIKQDNMMALVRFEWSGTCKNHVGIMGDFSNWKPVRMAGDPRLDVFYHTIELAVGTYRYRFIIDGKEEKVDENASQVDDSTSSIGVNNVVMVTNAAIGKNHTDKKQSAGLFQLDKKNLKFGRDSSIPKLRGITQNGIDSENEDDSESVNTLLTEDSLQKSNKINTQAQQYDVPGKIYHISKESKDIATSEELISQIRNINLRNMSVQDDGCWALGKALKRNHYIEILDLSFNDISDEGIQALSGGLQKCMALQTLKLNGNGFGVDACRYLVEAFTKTKFSDGVEGNGDHNKDDAPMSMSEKSKKSSVKMSSLHSVLRQIVTHSLRLQQLELSQNRIGCDGMEVWAIFLQHPCHRLQSLYLDSCYIGDDGMKALADSLTRNRWLVKLSLMHNNIQEIGSRVLAKALSFNGTLKHLSLSHNPLGPMGVKWLGDMLYQNDSLESLDLRHVYMLRGNNAMGLEAICYGLKHAKALSLHSGDVEMRGIKKLDLSHNELRNNHIIDLAHALTINTTLVDVQLESNHFSPKWWDPEKCIRTHILPEMPTLTMSLQKNRQLQKRLIDQSYAVHLMEMNNRASTANGKVTKAQAQQQAQQAKSGYIVDDVLVGYWTVRRQWKRLLEDEEVRRKRREAEAKELDRIQQEQARIMKELQHYLKGVAHYIDQEDDDGYEPCKEDILSLAKVLRNHIEHMIYFDPEEFHMHEIRRQSSPKWGKKQSHAKDSSDFVTLSNDTDCWETEDDDDDDDMDGHKIRFSSSTKSKKEKNVKPPKPVVKFIYMGKKIKGKQLHRLLEPEVDPVALEEGAQNNFSDDEDEDSDKGNDNQKKWFLPRIFGITTEFERQQKLMEEEERRYQMMRQQRSQLARKYIADVGMFMDCHMSLISSVFIILSGQKLTLMPTTVLELHPERLMQCLNMMAMPLYLLDLPPDYQNHFCNRDKDVSNQDEDSEMNGGTLVLSEQERQQRSLQAIANATMIHPEFSSRAQNGPDKLDITNITKNIAGRAYRTTHPMVALHRLADYLLRQIHRQGIDAPPSILSLMFQSTIASSESQPRNNRVASLRNMIVANKTPHGPTLPTSNAHQEKFHLHRMRILADLQLHPPVTEARIILLDTLRHRAFQTLLRSSPKVMSTLAPHFICPLCASRFTSEKLLYKHMKQAKMFQSHHFQHDDLGSVNAADARKGKNRHIRYHEMVGNAHKRFAFKESIHAGQYRLLVSAMEEKLGLSLPAYYELSEIDTVYSIKDEFYPQICDTLGKSGRPIGIVENFRTVRVEFALGDYLLVNLRQEYGWVKYRYRVPGTGGKHSAVPAQFLPLLRPLPGFDWITAGGRAEECYFRVNDNLPVHIELKIRYRPYLTEPHAAQSKENKKNGKQMENVLGYISKEDVVYVRYILGDWLQIRYHEEYVAWVLFRLPKPPVTATINSENAKSSTGGVKIPQESSKFVPGTAQSLVLVAGDYGTVPLTSMKIREVASPDKANNVHAAMTGSQDFPQDRLGKFANSFSFKTSKTNNNDNNNNNSLSSPPSSPFRNHTSQNITFSNIVRQRKLDHADVPIAITANNADIIFQDDIVTYELYGKFYKANLLKAGQNQVTRYKVHVFDRLRYGNPEVPLQEPGKRDDFLRKHQQLEMRTYEGLGDMTDHLLRLPNFLQYLLVDAESSGQDFVNENDEEEKKDDSKCKKNEKIKNILKEKKKDDNVADEDSVDEEMKQSKEYKRTAAIAAVSREDTAIIRSPVKLSQEKIFEAVMSIPENDLKLDMETAFIKIESEEDKANRFDFVRDEVYGAEDNEGSW